MLSRENIPKPGPNVEFSDKHTFIRRAAQIAWEDYQTTGLHLTGEETDEWLRQLEQGSTVPKPEYHV